MKKLGWIMLIISLCFLLKDALCVLIPLAGVIIGWMIIKNCNRNHRNGTGTDIIQY